MSRRSARASGTARVALVGASTPEGARVRAALEALGVPGNRVDLYATATGEAILSEYAGEARLIQEPTPDEIADHDVILLCEIGELTRGLLDRRRDGRIVIDLVGALPSSARSPLVHMDINPRVAEDHRGSLAVPHPLASVLAEMLHPLEQAFGVREAVAVVIRPAADFGEAGLEELRDQTVRLLSFAEIPVDTFGGQLAFNLIPQERLACDRPGIESTIADHVRRLLAWGEPRVTLRLLAAPVFHGHGIQLRVCLRDQASADQVRQALSSVGEMTGGELPTTPLEVAQEYRTSLARISADGLGGFWIWAVAGESAAKGAEQAIRIADALSDL